MLQTIIHPAGSAICFAIAMYACLKGNLILYKIVALTNQATSNESQEVAFYWTFSKWARLNEKYRLYFPEGDLVKKQFLYLWVMGLFMAGAAAFLIAPR